MHGAEGALAAAERCVVETMRSFFFDASAALLDIKERRLYTARNFLTFEAYVEGTQELGFGVRQANRLVGAARFVQGLPRGLQPPSCERHVRPLVGREVGKANSAWALAVQRCNMCSVPMTERLVQECLVEVTGGQGPAAAAHNDGAAEGPAPAVTDDVSEEGAEAGVNGRPVHLHSRSNEWYTPQRIIDLVVELFAPGMIDLDPCSTAEANTRVGAVRFFDAAADGLDPGNVYSGNVFCNPPFGVMAGGESMQGLFLERCLAEYREGRV
ncbi:hypothetical protein TSOC_014677, partial [Tetrabaena socialis]